MNTSDDRRPDRGRLTPEEEQAARELGHALRRLARAWRELRQALARRPR